MQTELIKALSCDGVAPSGPVSAWPKSRNENLQRISISSNTEEVQQIEHAIDEHAIEVEVSSGQMLRGAAQAAKMALTKGKVSREIYDERYATCQACPAFIESSNRCSKCGCFMKAKAWINADANKLCPLRKWER